MKIRDSLHIIVRSLLKRSKFNYILIKDMKFKLLLIAILAFSYDFGPGPGSTIENDLTIVWSCLTNSVTAVLTPLAKLFAAVITNIHCYIQNIHAVYLVIVSETLRVFLSQRRWCPARFQVQEALLRDKQVDCGIGRVHAPVCCVY